MNNIPHIVDTGASVISCKKLSDKEILDIANECLDGATAWHNPELDPIQFAREIIKRISEK